MKRHLLRGLMLLSLGCAPAATEQDSGVTWRKDLVYADRDGRLLHVDLALPAANQGPFPLVICIHGGGWQQGDRKNWHGFLPIFARHGFAAAAVEYRFAPGARFPAPLDDVRDAVRFLRRMPRFHLVRPGSRWSETPPAETWLYVAVTKSSDQPSTEMRGVVNYYGSMDMRTWKITSEGNDILRRAFAGKDLDQLIEDLLGTRDRDDPAMAAASPASHLDPDDPPILTFHGDKDLLVPVAEARQFDEAARKAGARHELVILTGSGHGFEPEVQDRTTRKMLEFLKEQFR
ncbi:MAG: alpha/beta hydrolase [Planctomycetota bacterium]